jgi:signal-induced proliferation-associated 1 like protein 3
VPLPLVVDPDELDIDPVVSDVPVPLMEPDVPVPLVEPLAVPVPLPLLLKFELPLVLPLVPLPVLRVLVPLVEPLVVPEPLVWPLLIEPLVPDPVVPEPLVPLVWPYELLLLMPLFVPMFADVSVVAAELMSVPVVLLPAVWP